MSENKILESLDKINKRLDQLEKAKPETIVEIAENVSKKGVTITDELTGFLNDLKEKWKAETQKAFDEQIQKAIDSQKLEISTVMRKTFGMDDNLPITKGEALALMRKAALEMGADSQKRTPAAEQNTPQLTIKADSFEAIEAAAYKKVGA